MILIFSIAIGANYSFELIFIETHAPQFIGYNKFFLGTAVCLDFLLPSYIPNTDSFGSHPHLFFYLKYRIKLLLKVMKIDNSLNSYTSYFLYIDPIGNHDTIFVFHLKYKIELLLINEINRF